MFLMRCALPGCLAAVLIGVLAYAGEPREAPAKRNPSDRAARAERVNDEASVLSYEGPGTMFERSDGLVVFSHDEDDPWAMAFNLHWDKETIKAADAGELPLLDVVGWLQIQYDARTCDLDVEWTDEFGQIFEIGYTLNSRGEVDSTEFHAYVVEFFGYMWGAVQFGAVAAVNCDGGECTCPCGGRPNDPCHACCPTGWVPDCNCDGSNCRCKCLKADSA